MDKTIHEGETGIASDQSQSKKVAAGAAMGQFLEWYDYGIYGFLAVPIAANFFANTNPTSALLATFAVFAVPFIARPFGGVFCGYLADKFGRQKMLVAVLLVISAVTVLIGVLPTHAQVGVLAPTLLVLLRLLQGISAGGEVVNAMSFVAEHAPPHRRALYMCWGQSGAMLALFAGNVVGLILANLLSHQDLIDWGWRIPFLLAFPLALVGLQMRRTLDESPAFRKLQHTNEKSKPLKRSLKDKKVQKAILMCATLSMLNSSGYYALMAFMPTYLTVNLGYPDSMAFFVTALAVVVLLLVIPVSAYLSDRLGRRPILIASSVAMALLAVPCYLLVRENVFLLITGLVLLAASFGLYTGTIHAALAELFPTSVRVTAYAVGYNFSTSIFGGAAPMLLVLLIAQFNSTLVPAYYMIVTAIITAIAAYFMRETNRKELSEEAF